MQPHLLPPLQPRLLLKKPQLRLLPQKLRLLDLLRLRQRPLQQNLLQRLRLLKRRP